MKSSLFVEFDSLFKDKPELIIQKIQGGRAVDVPLEWTDEILEIDGVGKVYPRIFGTYFFEMAGRYFTIVGFSLLEESYDIELQHLLDNVDFKSFQKREGIYVGKGVLESMSLFYYRDEFSFFFGDGEKLVLPILGSFTKQSSLETNDIILMSEESSRTILNISTDAATDIVAYIPNPSEKRTIAKKIREVFPNARVLDSTELKASLKRNYDIFGGIFFIFFLLPLLSFLLLFYSKISTLTDKGREQVAILRTIGWEIPLIMHWHAFSMFFISSLAYMTGVLLSYLYVFWLNAPGLSQLFLGYANLPVDFSFTAIIPLETLFYLFIVTVFPYTLACVIPIYRASIVSPLEILR